ncbi:cytochrome C oxidase subunit IV family protein [Haloferula rosea]|uniref:Cytochrome C oxidase subunit IV family protein n=1 Tax=Haloferula rosea TaxID=490093 RepID=A0A934VER6_9BACT|nr:cytochrome C oxidase subunit IV family protein [Haloferula rosea]MBK1826306.1 cytochrome C oxidase subunit IV family protein [Haloferula rosea]
MADSPEDIKKSIKLYLIIGAALFVGTVLTVMVATVPAMDIGGHGFDKADMILGLLIATAKATLVALIFMHLNHEKAWVYWTFGFGIFFAVAMVALIFLAKGDPIEYEGFRLGGPTSEAVSE